MTMTNDSLTTILSTLVDDEIMHAVNTLLAEEAIAWRPDPFIPEVFALVSTAPGDDPAQAMLILYLTDLDRPDFETSIDDLHNMMHTGHMRS